MKWFAETTAWDTNTPNHIYLLDNSKSKMHAYVPAGSSKPFQFSKPIGFDSRGRKFSEVPNSWDFELKTTDPLARTITVPGSKGNVYTVSETENGWSCSCSGFKFRGDCKHIKNIK